MPLTPNIPSSVIFTVIWIEIKYFDEDNAIQTYDLKLYEGNSINGDTSVAEIAAKAQDDWLKNPTLYVDGEMIMPSRMHSWNTNWQTVDVYCTITETP